MANQNEKSKVLEAEQNLKITQIQAIFEQITDNVNFIEGQEIVAFVGPTKAGKSTLINCLMDNPMKCKKDPRTEETSIESTEPGKGPAIGAFGESQTFIPKGYSNIPGTEWPMWDFPGFGDNKGTEQEIANAAAYERVLRPQKNVRFVLVVPIDLIKSDNPMQFYKLLSDIVLICPNIAESFCLIATKSEKGTVDAWLEKARSAKFTNASKENAKVAADAKMLIDSVLKNKHYIDFKAPVMTGDDLEQNFKPPNQDKIINLIKSLKGTSVGDFPLVISDQAKHDILLLYTVFYQTIRREVENICEHFEKFVQIKINEVLESKEEDGKPTSSASRLALFKQGKQKITEILDNSENFNDFFLHVKSNGFHVESVAESVEKFIFIEKVQNMYKLKEQRSGRGEKEFFSRILIALNSSAQKYSDLIKNSEVATAEEKKFEQAWKDQKEREKDELKKQVEELERDNESLLVRGAKWIARNPVVKLVEQGIKSACNMQ